MRITTTTQAAPRLMIGFSPPPPTKITPGIIMHLLKDDTHSIYQPIHNYQLRIALVSIITAIWQEAQSSRALTTGKGKIVCIPLPLGFWDSPCILVDGFVLSSSREGLLHQLHAAYIEVIEGKLKMTNQLLVFSSVLYDLTAVVYHVSCFHFYY